MAQQGFQYEINASNFLKGLGYVPKDFVPAGAGHDQPDLMLQFKGKKAGCELKISAASAGSLVLKYNSTTSSWGFGNIKAEEEEKIFIRDLAKEIDLFTLISQSWKEIPYKRDNDPNWGATVGMLDPKSRYERDRDTFPDIRGEIPASTIENYYMRKKTYYVNIGTHGFYLMGPSNPLKLKNVVRFGQAAKATYRARVQYKGGGNYQFTFEMQFSIPSSAKSKFNIAPIDGKTVNIIGRLINLDCFK